MSIQNRVKHIEKTVIGLIKNSEASAVWYNFV